MEIAAPPDTAPIGARRAAVATRLDPHTAREVSDEGLGIGVGDEIEQQDVGQARQSLFDMAPPGWAKLLVARRTSAPSIDIACRGLAGRARCASWRANSVQRHPPVRDDCLVAAGEVCVFFFCSIVRAMSRGGANLPFIAILIHRRASSV